MRPLWKDVLTALFMGLILPGLMLNFAVMYLDARPGIPEETAPVQPQPEAAQLPVLVQTAGSVEQWKLEDYLVGVVLAEMPASFEPEALKAQSVAARTYTRKAWETGGKHGNSSVCTEAACCQAYISPESYLARGGTGEGLEKVRSAVYATAGQVLTYEGELIEATYFSCSGGSTEDAVAVWGTDYPYLQAVPSPGEEEAVHYTGTVTFTAEEFRKALGRPLFGSPASWFGTVAYTEGGGVASMTVAGESYTGTELRSLLGLKSTAFSVEPGENSVTFTTRGYGHRVGMSQYGADAMAVQGSSYADILAHYYPGTALKYLEP